MNQVRVFWGLVVVPCQMKIFSDVLMCQLHGHTS